MGSIIRRISRGRGCELVVYEDDGHGLKRHRQEMFGKMLNFLENYTAPSADRLGRRNHHTSGACMPNPAHSSLDGP